MMDDGGKMTALNLVDDPWITVVRTDGSHTQVGFRGLFLESSGIRSIETGWAVSDNAVFDIALAIAYRSLDLSDDLNASATSKASRYLSDPEAIGREVSTYLDGWLHHFDIETFGQIADVTDQLAVGVDRLALELSSSGKNPQDIRPGTFRSLRNVLEQSIEQFAVDLVTTYRADLTKPASALPGSSFDMLDYSVKSGRKRPEDGIIPQHVGDGDVKTGKRNMGGLGLAHYPRLTLGGKTFAETVIYNMPPQSKESKSKDLAVWESDYTSIDSRTRVGYRGYADWLTYQSRAIKTFWSEDGYLESVVVAPNNFRVNSGATGSHAVGENSDKTAEFYAASPFLVRRYRKGPKGATMEDFIASDTLEKFLPMSLPVEVSWAGLTAFTANNSEAIGLESTLRGGNVEWFASLVEDDVVSLDSHASATYFGTARGPSDTSFLIGYQDTYSITGWLASPDARQMRSTIDGYVRRSQGVRVLLSKLEAAVVRGLANDPKVKVNPREVGIGVTQRYVGMVSESLHRLVSQASEGTQRDLARLMESEIRDAANAALSRIEKTYPADKVATSDIPKIVETARSNIMSLIAGEKPLTKTQITAAMTAEPERSDAWDSEVSSFVNSRIGAAKRDVALRVDYAAIGRANDPMSNPEAVMSTFRDWSDAVSSRENADWAVQSALGIWGTTSGASRDTSGGLPLFVVAKKLSSKSDAVMKYVRSVLSTKDKKLIVHHLSALVSLLSSIDKRPSFGVNFGALAADLYELSYDPKNVQYRWARQFSIGKAI